MPSQKQIDKFKELARDVEADEDEAAFDERLRQMRERPKPSPKPDKER